jgi:hypothetical protein
VRWNSGKARALPFLSEGIGRGVSRCFGQQVPDGQRMRSLSAAFTAGLACKAPST